MIRVLLSVLVLVILSSCAALRDDSQADRKAALAPGLAVNLPRPVGLDRAVRASQIVTLQWSDQTFTFLGQIEAGPATFTLIGLDMLGQRALTVHWTDTALTAETVPSVPDGFDVRNVLADIVVIYWPEAVVRRMLGEAGGVLQAEGRSRSVSVDGHEVIRIEYNPSETAPWSGEVHYVNKGWKYKIDIRSVEAAP
jgi:Protein of unknown function (DUF3261)